MVAFITTWESVQCGLTDILISPFSVRSKIARCVALTGGDMLIGVADSHNCLAYCCYAPSIPDHNATLFPSTPKGPIEYPDVPLWRWLKFSFDGDCINRVSGDTAGLSGLTLLSLI